MNLILKLPVNEDFLHVDEDLKESGSLVDDEIIGNVCSILDYDDDEKNGDKKDSIRSFTPKREKKSKYSNFFLVLANIDKDSFVYITKRKQKF